MTELHPLDLRSKLVGAIAAARAGSTVFLATVAVALGLKLFVVEAFRIPSGSMERTLAVGDFILVNKLAYALQSPRTIPFTSVSIPHASWNIFGTIHRRDVVVFEFDEENSGSTRTTLIKRIVGLPGDRVEMKDGETYVNGVPFALPALGIPMHKGLQLNARAWDVPAAGESVQLSSQNFSQWQSLIREEGHTAELTEHGVALVDGKVVSTYTVEQNYYFVLGDHREESADSRVWGFVPQRNVIGEALMVYWSWDTESHATAFGGWFSSIRWDRIGTLVR